ncbi:MAG: tRNA lysidine(34) synthetase TilS [Anaerolineales bacterium]
MSHLLDSLPPYLQTACGLRPNLPVLVGVSGGADSLCLLDVLHHFRYPVIAAHFNHHLRAEADEDAVFVRDVATRLGVLFVGGEGDVTGFSRENGLSIEEAARTLRYQFLFTQARAAHAQAVAVGHHADDQVETVLMHFLRGAGLDGLTGMRPRTILPVWDAEIPLVRPLLETSKADLLAYCQEKGYFPREDTTNQDTTYYRNRLRHALIPELETYNPRFRETLLRTANLLAVDQETLHGLTEQAWARCLLCAEPTYLALSLPTFQVQLPSIQRRLLRKGIETLRPGLRDVDFATIGRALNFLEAKKEGVCELTGKLRIFIEGERAWLAESETDLPTDEWPQIAEEMLPLIIGGEVELRAGWRLRAEPTLARGPVPAGSDRAWVDARALPPLTVRCRRPGDVFHPFGMAHPVKLSHFLINAKIPRRARDFWPLVCAGEEIVWIPGVRLGERFRVGENSSEVLELSLEHEVPVSSHKFL